METQIQLVRGDEGHASVFNRRMIYARALAAAGDIEVALREYEILVEHAVALFGEDARQLGFSLQNSVSLKVRAGRIDDALASAERAERILSKLLDRRAATFASVLGSRAEARLAARRAREALADFDEAIGIAVEKLGSKHRKTVQMQLWRVHALAALGRVEEARRDLAAISQTNETSDERLRVTAIVHRLSGNHVAALEGLERYQLALRSTLYDEHDRAACAAEIALTKAALGYTGANEAVRVARSRLKELGMTQSTAYFELAALNESDAN
jgi:vacuolar-type H+-ATPase subunit I/STV1